MDNGLNDARMEAVTRALLASGARRVLDLGCGGGALLTRLLQEARFSEIVGLDIAAAALARAAARLRADHGAQADRVVLLEGSYAVPDRRLIGFDAAAMVETIEHVDPDRLSTVERAVFACYRPRTVVLTTPNADCNALYARLVRGRRRADHRFEWTCARFEAWAAGVAERNGYEARFDGIGPRHPSYGSPTQMAVFARLEAPVGRARLAPTP